MLDDTQAFGILGEGPLKSNPYGMGGGGSLRWHGVYGPHIIVGSSLAKVLPVDADEVGFLAETVRQYSVRLSPAGAGG